MSTSAFTFNSFAAISDMEDAEIVSEVSEPETKVEPIAPLSKTPEKKSWAEMSMETEEEEFDLDDDFQFPALGVKPETVENEKIVAKKQEERERNARNRELAKLSQVTIRYGKDGDKSRTLKVASMNVFKHLEKVIGMVKPRSRDGRIDRKDQTYKIKATNDLLSTCYKHPTKPFCFVYAIAEIQLGDDKVLRAGHVEKDSKKSFKIVHREYFVE